MRGRARRNRGTLLSADEIVHALRMMALQRGEPLTFHRFMQHSGVPEWQVYRHFQSWYDVREAAGLPRTLPCSRRVSEERLIEAVHQIAQQLKRFPTAVEFARLSGFSNNLIYRRIGRWDKVRRRYRGWLEEQEDLAQAAKRAGPAPELAAPGKPVRDVAWIRETWLRQRVCYETESRNFQGRDPNEFDLLVVLDHNWRGCPLPVLELGKVLGE